MIGYVRKAGQKGTIKLSLNVSAMDDAEVYTTADGQRYISCEVSILYLRQILDGLRTVAVIHQGVSE